MYFPKTLFVIPKIDQDFYEDDGNGRKHYPPDSFRDPKQPPDICPICKTKTHVEIDIVYCQNRHHSWAIPSPVISYRELKHKESSGGWFYAPKPRTIVCAECGKEVTGIFPPNRRYCSNECYKAVVHRTNYERARRISLKRQQERSL